MKKLINLFVILTIIGLGNKAFAQKDADRISDYINPEELNHPYLLFNQEGKEQMLEDIKKDRELGEIYEMQLLKANRYLKLPKDYSLPDRGDTESDYYSNLRSFQYANLKPALNLAFAYQMTGNPEYAEKAFFHADMLCQINDWTYFFHQFPYVYRRV